MALMQGYSALGLHTPAALDSVTMAIMTTTTTTTTAIMLTAATCFGPAIAPWSPPL
jgi:hypothetical protein